MRQLFGMSLTLLALLPLAQTAKANCSRGADYDITVTNSTVQICPGGTTRTCGGAIEMLRQNVDSGEVVALANFCVDSSGTSCYEDECVPNGNYRYGFATPYSCDEVGCAGVAFWRAASVSAGGGGIGTCTISSGNSAPTAYSAGAPWPATGNGEKDCPGCRCGATSPSALVVLALAVIYVRRRRRA